MKHTPFLLLTAALLLSGCVHESSVPLGNDKAEINVSAAKVYGRAGAQRIAFEDAAKFTLKMGYDKFTVDNQDAWSENSALNNSVTTHPEAKMVIRMYHDGDKGSEKAIDARAILEMNKDTDNQTSK